MVANFKVYKKCSPNGKLAVYLGKRDFIDYLSGVEPVDGVVLIGQDYVDSGRKIWCQLICSFRYGREEDETMGLNFQKDLYLASEQIFPQTKKPETNPTKLQDRLRVKLTLYFSRRRNDTSEALILNVRVKFRTFKVHIALPRLFRSVSRT